jgi:hypothetical protein
LVSEPGSVDQERPIMAKKRKKKKKKRRKKEMLKKKRKKYGESQCLF